MQILILEGLNFYDFSQKFNCLHLAIFLKSFKIVRALLGIKHLYSIENQGIISNDQPMQISQKETKKIGKKIQFWKYQSGKNKK